MSICPAKAEPRNPREKASIAEQQKRLDLIARRLFGVQRILQDLSIAELAHSSKQIADAVIDLEEIRNDLPSVIGTELA